MGSYSFPEINKFRARTSLLPTFNIMEGYESQLYVDFTEIRGNELFEKLYYFLGIDDNDKLVEPSDKFEMKIMFSGHIGCGKTVELRRFHKQIHNPDRYFAIFVPLEEKKDFKPEDFYLLTIVKFIDSLEKAKIKFDRSNLDEILTDWLLDAEIKKEYINLQKIDAGTEGGIGANLLNFLKIDNFKKSFFSSQSKTIKTVRKKVRDNPMSLINKLNDALDSARKEIRKTNPKRDFLFIIDSSQNIKELTYQKIFIEGVDLIGGINAKMICSVPIYYSLKQKEVSTYYHVFELPLITVNDESKIKLKQIITKRVNEEQYFNADILDYFVEMSGGCPKFLLEVAHEAIKLSIGEKIKKNKAIKAVTNLGEAIHIDLTEDHKNRLKLGNYNDVITDEIMVDMLSSSHLLKYKDGIKMNPLLESYMIERRI